MPLIIADRVKEASTTTGTGDFALAGAATQFVAFSNVCSIGDTFYYAITGPTTEWEVGLGTYSAANTLTRTTVTASSNAGGLVNFSAGTKYVWIDFTAAQAKTVREALTANRTYYVRTDGSDSNNGLANTAGGAFLTIQKAVDVVCNTLSLRGFAVTIQVADGTYTGATILRPLPDYGSITIQGNAATPSNVVISTTAARCFTANQRCEYTIKDMTLQTATTGGCLVASQSGIISFSNIVFGACAGAHMEASAGGRVIATGNYTVTGSAQDHFYAVSLGVVAVSAKTITITGTPAFASGFAFAADGGLCAISTNTYSGSATGKYYDVSRNGVIGSWVQLPGNAAGTTATGGQYV